MKKLFILTILVIFQLNVCAKDEIMLLELTKKAEIAWLQFNEEAIMDLYSFSERLVNADEKNYDAKYFNLYSQYLLINKAMVNENDELFDLYYDASLEKGEKLAKNKTYRSEVKVLLAAITMMKIANSPMQAPFLSGKVHAYLDEAKSIQPNNPRIAIVRGMMKFNTPGMFGGSKEDAEALFNKAISIFEKNDFSAEFDPQWGKLEAYAWLGRTYESLENYGEALKTYNKVLEENENCGWVKYNLLPKLQEKMKEEL